MSSYDKPMSIEDMIRFECMDAYTGFNLPSEMETNCFGNVQDMLGTYADYATLSPASPSSGIPSLHNPLTHSLQPYFDQESLHYSFALMGNPPPQAQSYLASFGEISKPKEEPAPPSRRMPSLKPKTIPCPFPGCSRVFSRQYNMRAHLEIHAPVRTKDHACPDCGRPFSRRHDMYRHQRNIHHTNKQKLPSLQPGLYHTHNIY